MMFSSMGRIRGLSSRIRVPPGTPNISLTPPDMHTVKHIMADGNCLFRYLAFIITGSENRHMAIHTAILEHVIDINCVSQIHVSGLSYQSLWVGGKELDKSQMSYKM